MSYAARQVGPPRTGPEGAFLCVDLGASSMRVAVFARDGEGLGLASAPLRLAAEADPEAWFAALEALAGEALSAACWPRVDAVAIAAFTRSEVHLDAAGAVLRPALTFRDARAVEEAARIDARLGGRGEVTAFSPLARLDWIRGHEPAVFARMALVLQPKDFLNFRLTGVAAADPASNAPLVGATRGYLAARFAAAGIEPGSSRRCARPPTCSAACARACRARWAGSRGRASPSARWIPGRRRWASASTWRVPPTTSPARRR